jgi:hypothetical protein
VTLSTDVYIHEQVDGDEVFHFCRSLIGATPEVKYTADEQSIGNDPDQGLCAWLIVYRKDGMVQPEPEGHDEWCEPDCTYSHPTPAHWVKVNFDTAYTYRGEKGEDCAALHASLIAQLGTWLDGRGVSWSWSDEFTGEVHKGYEDLRGLCRGGKEATAWFDGVVLPAIQRGVL